MKAVHKFLISLGVFLLLSFITLINSFEMVDVTEFAYRYDKVTGEMSSVVDENNKPLTGLIWKRPFLETIHTIETLPERECLGVSNVKVLNCVLLQFDPKGWRDFIMTHGRGDYSNGMGLNSLNKTLLPYAYSKDPSQYKFLKVTTETENSND